ncbi:MULTISPECIES: 3-oxoacid CoA-transferase subunit B [unclassified Marinobacter]|jgi:3-oxoacid CoA-transferase B subunit|uniref:3-oxoacid CoA-transferase subunit B n=1 Tax=unclassified Marinobacter TaxID=83889 RepID=UPI00201080C3|nr:MULTISPECIES: 3-oxoacid CoA-transferase subunit B [unclassified Marinobacter]UQG55366.1 3-oxoacid CoA-transferase subunit B [Marinobacter sp. M4C]UQG64170.1 3-oxoacid CoA-transferase subunit B [Marinobacter sp. M2C]UQG68449.1 3-oxoacid CoA-transferase subunit B [Marinobacter sp. M1C]
MPSDQERILARAAREILPGQIVNLGIGLPQRLFHYMPEDQEVLVHSENGILGCQPVAENAVPDYEMIDSGGAYIGVTPGASVFDSAVSFAMIRRSRVNVTFMGAFEVDQQGNLANWKIPGKFSPGIGGAMELAQKVEKLVVLCSHNDKHGNPKILRQCRLPLTAPRCASLIVTEKAVMAVTERGLEVIDIAENLDVETLRAATEAELIINESQLGRF